MSTLPIQQYNQVSHDTADSLDFQRQGMQVGIFPPTHVLSIPVLVVRAGTAARMKRKLRYWFASSMTYTI